MKTNLDSRFKTDKELEENGVWFKPDRGGEYSFLVRRFGGANAHRLKLATEKYVKPHLRKIEAGAMSQEDMDKVNLQAFISSCIVDWKGVKDEDGKEIPFSFETALEVLLPLEELSNTLYRYANSFETYREELGKF
jgi:hypothetical protein